MTSNRRSSKIHPRTTSRDERADETIAMRGVLNFRFPAHASAEVRKQVVARFVREAQAKIDEEQAIELQLAAIRERLTGHVRPASVTFEEAASQMGLTVAQLEREVSRAGLLVATVGYVKVLSEPELGRLYARTKTKKPKRVAAPAS